MKRFRSDLALYKLMYQEKLIGFSGCYVDDLLRTGLLQFLEIYLKMHDRFRTGQNEEVLCEFSWVSLSENSSAAPKRISTEAGKYTTKCIVHKVS
eukprot:IDg14121t1